MCNFARGSLVNDIYSRIFRHRLMPLSLAELSKAEQPLYLQRLIDINTLKMLEGDLPLRTLNLILD